MRHSEPSLHFQSLLRPPTSIEGNRRLEHMQNLELTMQSLVVTANGEGRRYDDRLQHDEVRPSPSYEGKAEGTKCGGVAAERATEGKGQRHDKGRANKLKKCLHLDLNKVSTCHNDSSLPEFVPSSNGGVLSPRQHFAHPLRVPRPSKLFPVHILPLLFLGNDETAKSREKIEQNSIRYVINVTSDLPNYFEDDDRFVYMRIPVDDNCSHNLARFFPEAISFIERARSDCAGVLVHCWAGISRSVTVCLAYLMFILRCTLEEAFDRLLKQNGTIAPNFHFMEALTCWERELFACNFSHSPLGIEISPEGMSKVGNGIHANSGAFLHSHNLNSDGGAVPGKSALSVPTAFNSPVVTTAIPF
ncbi:hypothetical protein niasHS_007303 [Heterodera schachtii]|uniref:protein-tyrosine-phosphatase n=1 Tax=Heterodera schachtii TaxID=97005 RepID=A0ABD2JK17_HETSC